VGASSADIRLRALVEVTGARRTLGREWRMESCMRNFSAP
jgi:beta-glucosidase